MATRSLTPSLSLLNTNNKQIIKMKKIYIMPAIQVIHLSVEDTMLAGSISMGMPEGDITIDSGAEVLSDREPEGGNYWSE